MILFATLLLMLAGGVLAWLVERVRAGAARWVSLVTLVLSLGLLVAASAPAVQHTGDWYVLLRLPWIPRFGIDVHLGLDGLSLLLVALTLVLGIVAVLASWTEIVERRGAFQLNLLWTLAGVVGVFTALDLFLFFFFWEVMLVPMYFLIAIWGHEARAYASMKFFLFTQISGLVMLLAILALVYSHYAASGEITFDYFALLDGGPDGTAGFLIMLGFFIAFLVKLPGVPFHTWLPDAHTQAPTAGSVVLAGVLLKTGAYGLLRFVLPLFPEASQDFRMPAMLLGVASVIYGGFLAFAQTDFKRLVAYSSIAHMGFVLLGVYAWNTLALQGAVVQMVAHGFSTAALFMMAGALQERLHTREMTQMGGLWAKAPRMGALTLFFAVASLGLPGLGNFIGEFLVLLGAFQVSTALTVVAGTGLVIAAVYALWLVQRAFQGRLEVTAEIRDFGGRELSAQLPHAVALVGLGLYPNGVLSLSSSWVEHLVSLFGVGP